MASLTQSESDFVSKAFDQALTRVENLAKSNERNDSTTRSTAIETLQVHLEQIQDLGFFGKTDFSPEEIKTIIDAASQLTVCEQNLEDTHEFTLMEMETDLAQVLQSIMLGRFLRVLRFVWGSANRHTRVVPDQIPEEVADEFNVGVFNKTQGSFNWRAYILRDVIEGRCLNNEDYSEHDIAGWLLSNTAYAAREATDNYIQLQRLKKAERDAREANEVSLGGRIWDVFGWDNPTDFLIDVGLAVATGGASKVVRWGRRLSRVTKQATKAVTKLEKLLAIQNRATYLEQRVLQVRQAAERLKRANNVLQLPKKIQAAFKVLNSARGKRALAELAAQTVTKDYIRSVASSVAAKSTGLAGSARVGQAASKELARASILAYLDGTPLGKEIKELRGSISYTLMITGGFNSKNQERMMRYFGLLLLREFIARMTISATHKRSLTVEQIVNEFTDSARSALETMLLDVPFISSMNLKFLGRTILSSISKLLAEIAKPIATKLAQELFGP